MNETAPEVKAKPFEVISTVESIQFMADDLARSGLVPSDFPIPPEPRPTKRGGVSYRLHYTKDYYKDRYDREENKYIGPKDVTPPIVRLGNFHSAKVTASIEGFKKAVAFHISTGIPTLVIDGCWSFGEQVEPETVKELHNDIISALTPGQNHIVIFDGDWSTNDQVKMALATYHMLLEEQGVKLKFKDMGADSSGKRHGYDDWLVNSFGRDRAKWPSITDVLDQVITKVADIPSSELLETARSFALGTVDRFSASYLDLTDRGTGSLLLKKIGAENLRYLTDTGAWVQWLGGRWINIGEDPYSLVDIAAQHYLARAKILSAQAEKMADSDEYKARKAMLIAQAKNYGRWATGHCSSVAGRGSILKDMRSRRGVQATLADFDTDPDLLGVKNGVVDLVTGQLRLDEQRDMILKRCPIHYPSAEPNDLNVERIKRFLREISGHDHDKPDQRRLTYLQRRLGASLRGRNSLTAIELWHGAGANGKSVLSNLIQKALGLTKDGGYAATVDAGVILSSYKQRDAEASTPFRMQLIGARLAFMSETTDTAHLNEAFLKQITGGDLLPARGNYQSGGTYDVTFSPILLTNNLPNIAEGGKALWDRLAPFKFNVRWRRPNKLIVDTAEATLPKGDSWFETHAPKLEEILQYTLWWLVQGGVDWERNGLGEAPADVLDGVRQYMSDQDKLEEWMTEMAGFSTLPAEQRHRRY